MNDGFAVLGGVFWLTSQCGGWSLDYCICHFIYGVMHLVSSRHLSRWCNYSCHFISSIVCIHSVNRNRDWSHELHWNSSSSVCGLDVCIVMSHHSVTHCLTITDPATPKIFIDVSSSPSIILWFFPGRVAAMSDKYMEMTLEEYLTQKAETVKEVCDAQGL